MRDAAQSSTLEEPIKDALRDPESRAYLERTLVDEVLGFSGGTKAGSPAHIKRHAATVLRGLRDPTAVGGFKRSAAIVVEALFDGLTRPERHRLARGLLEHEHAPTKVRALRKRALALTPTLEHIDQLLHARASKELITLSLEER